MFESKEKAEEYLRGVISKFIASIDLDKHIPEMIKTGVTVEGIERHSEFSLHRRAEGKNAQITVSLTVDLTEFGKEK